MINMNQPIPSSYKNYLPSRNLRILIGIIIIGIAGYFLVPPVFRSIKKLTTPTTPKTDLLVAVPTGDPLTRDSDGDGVPDWEEILVGLDPHNPETKPGVPDLVAFNKIKASIGNNLFDTQASQVTDTDKVSLAIYDDLSTNSVKNGGVSGTSTAIATGQEILNYISARRAKIIKITTTDVNLVPDSLDSNTKYSNKMKSIFSNNNTVFKNAPDALKGYLTGNTDRSTIDPALAFLQKTIADLKAAPVPYSAKNLHLEVLNELQEIYQVINEYDPKNTDEITQVSTSSLIQDDIINLAKSVGNLSIYFSVALDPKGYVQ
jgi:hypothetical protein